MFREESDTHRLAANQILIVALLGAALCIVPSTALAAKPPANSNGQLSIVASPKQVTAGGAVAITGKLKGTPSVGQEVSIQVNPFPFAGFVSNSTTSTDASGNYRFSVMPTLNTRYRVQTTTVTPAQTSGEITVPVAPRISLTFSDRTPKSGQLVRFFGRVWPSHDGSTVQIQRRTATGTWQTVGRTTLKDDGDLRSTYSRRVRIRKNGTFRVQLLADADHATGYSTARFVRVH